MQEVLVPAVVAVITTLLVEYLAKPGLDARKDRILERDRQRRDAGRALGEINYETGRLGTYRDADLRTDPLRTRAIGIARELGPRLTPLIRDLDVPEAFEDQFYKDAAVVHTLAVVMADTHTSPTPEEWDEFERAAEWLADPDEYMQTPRRRWFRRRTLRNRLKAAGADGS